MKERLTSGHAVLLIVVLVLGVILFYVTYKENSRPKEEEPGLPPESGSPRHTKVYVDNSGSMRGFARHSDFSKVVEFLETLQMWRKGTTFHWLFAEEGSVGSGANLSASELRNENSYTVLATPLESILGRLAEQQDVAAFVVLTDSVQSTSDERESYPVAKRLVSFLDSGYEIQVVAFRRGFRGRAYSEKRGGTDIGGYDSDAFREARPRPLYLYLISREAALFGWVEDALIEADITGRLVLQLPDRPFDSVEMRRPQFPLTTNEMGQGRLRNAFQSIRFRGGRVTVRLSDESDVGYIRVFRRVQQRSASLRGLEFGLQSDYLVGSSCSREVRVEPPAETASRQGDRHEQRESGTRWEPLQPPWEFTFIPAQATERPSSASQGDGRRIDDLIISGYIQVRIPSIPPGGFRALCKLWLNVHPGWAEPTADWEGYSTDDDSAPSDYDRTYLVVPLLRTLVSAWAARIRVPGSEITLETRRDR
jgi:hypothetical protein